MRVAAGGGIHRNDGGAQGGVERTRRAAMQVNFPTPRWPDPVAQMYRMQADMNRLFGDLRLSPWTEFPPVNLWTNPEGAILTAAIPGVPKDEIDIAVHRDTVTIRGNRKLDIENEEEATILREERNHGPFVRSVKLPFRVDADRAVARFERGVLTLELPRPEEDKPRKIKIASS
jgi:HSP20 family protein